MKTYFILLGTIMAFCGYAQVVDSVSLKQVDSLIQISRSLMDKKEFNRALEVNTYAEKIALEKFGKESVGYSSVCSNFGRFNFFIGNLMEAEKWFLQALSIRENILGKSDPRYGSNLRDLTVLYLRFNKFESAEPFCLEFKEYCEKTKGKEHIDYLGGLVNLGSIYRGMGNLAKAELAYTEAKEIFEMKLNDRIHPFYINCIYNLGLLLIDIGQFDEAETYLIEGKNNYERIYGKEDPVYAQSLFNLGVLYMAMNNYELALPFYLDAKKLYEKLYGGRHPDYASCLINLAYIYLDFGQFENAELFNLEALNIYEMTLGRDHPNYALGLNNMGIFYTQIGNHVKAKHFYLNAMTLRKKNLGEFHVDYAGTLINLGNVYMIMDSLEAAELHLLEAINIFRQKPEIQNHLYFPSCLGSLGLLNYRQGQYQIAESILIEAISAYKLIEGKVPSDHSIPLLNLGMVYEAMGNYGMAEAHYLEGLKIWSASGKDHPFYARSLAYLGKFYENKGNYAQSEILFSESFAIEQSNLLKGSLFLSELELSKYVAAFHAESEYLYSSMWVRMVNDLSLDESILPALGFNYALFYKGFLLNKANRVNLLMGMSPELTLKINRLKGYRRRLADEYAKPLLARVGVTDLEGKANEVEKALIRDRSDYAEAMQQISWEDLKNKLNHKEAVIEFIHFPLPEKSESIIYGAFLLLPESKQPLLVPLFEEREFDALLNERQQRKSNYVNNLYSWADRDTLTQKDNGRSLTKLGGQKQSLYELIWKKIEAAGLKDVKTIYYAPSGLLHRINMGAIAIDENQRISDRYQLVAMNSTRQIVTGVSDSTYTMGNNAVVYGGIQFEADTTGIIQQDKSEFPLMATRSLAAVAEDTTLRGGTWQYLHWTQKEAEVISTTLSKGGLHAEHRSGLEATEESFKVMSQSNIASPRVLHIATHGFFFPDPEQKTATSLDDQSVFKWSDNPMIRSGLILAGGNYAWQNGKPVSPDKEDGILTAYEISQMNLSNTELVVLSACETGLGDIQGNEGVYGLQRAFKIAGAKYLIMSLWQVPDRETMEFMTTFYKNWLPSDAEALAGKKGKMTIPEAFRKTQGEMREKYDDVYSWGAFVLVE